MDTRLNVLLVEDDERARDALTTVLCASEANIAMCRDVCNGRAALRAVAEADFDVALIDLGLPDMHGTEVVAAFARLNRPVPSVVLTVFEDDRSLHEAVLAGARGYLLKDEEPGRVVAALLEVSAGGAPLSSRLTPALFAAVRRDADEVPVHLTRRERELLCLFARGCTYDECARLLGLKVGTVQGYVKSLYRRLDVCTKAEASALAVKFGLVDGSRA